MENKRRVKLYKAGKLWCAMALTTVALGAGLALNGTQASADSNVMESSATVTNTAPAEKQLSAIENSEVQPAPDSTTVPAQETSVDPNDHGNYAWLDQQQINSQGQLVATGWHATNESADRNYHYIIAYDQSNHTEIGRQLVGDTAQQVDRSDVARVHHVAGAGQSGFKVTFDLGKILANTQSIQLISRYSSDKSGNQDYIDYWFAPITVNRDNNASLDSAVVVDGKLQLAGWHASNLAADKANHFIIIYDQTLGHELTRQRVDSVSRPDVAKVYSDVENAGHSGFNVSFNLAGLDFNHQLQIISRYSSSTDGNSDYLDYWFAPITTGNYANQGCLDVLNLSNAKQVTVSGWHANDISRFATNHFLILYDNTANRQVAATTVVNGQRPDVARAFSAITTAGKSGFTGSFDLSSTQLVGGHTYSVVSRYSTSDQGNGGTGSYADYWFAPFTLNRHAFSLDSVKMTDQGLRVTGWVDLPTWRALGYSDDLWYGIDSYVQPLQVTNPGAGRQAHIEAMINAAYQYLGKPWWAGCSSAPAWGVDCSGLVMQALYAAGINPTSASSTHHGYPGNEWNSRNLFADPHFANVGWNDRQRGDLVFYYEPGTRTIWHVAILLDPNTVIESWPPSVMVQPILNGQRNVIAGIRRVFA